jgi:O-methyltransferase
MSGLLNAGAGLAAFLRITRFVRRILPRRVRIWISLERGVALVPAVELQKRYRDALCFLTGRRRGDELGDYLEFGVFRGTSLLCMWDALQDLQLDRVRIFGFDSFEGLPDIEAAEDRDLPWQPGDFPSDYEKTLELIYRAGVDQDRVFLIKGWYKDTLTDALRERFGLRKASVIMIDCDFYASAKQALEFCAPLIQDEAMIFFDDWEGGEALADRNLGEKRAFDEFLAAHDELAAEEYGTYYHTEWPPPPPVAKIFCVSRTSGRGGRGG